VLSAVDHLILDLGLGARRATGRDLEMIRLHVAQAGFDPQATFPADRRVVGLRRSNGQIIRRGDMLPTTSSTPSPPRRPTGMSARHHVCPV
jgi:hypothetical protein